MRTGLRCLAERRTVEREKVLGVTVGPLVQELARSTVRCVASRRHVERCGLARGRSGPLIPPGVPRRCRRGGGRGPPPEPRPHSRRWPSGGGRRIGDQPSRRTRRPRSLRASARDLSGVEGAEPLASPLFPQRVGWLDHLSVAQASPAAARKDAPASRPRRRWPGCRGQAPRPLGCRPHGRRAQRATRHFLASAALPAAHRFPPCPYPSQTRDRRSWANLRPRGIPETSPESPKTAFEPVGGRYGTSRSGLGALSGPPDRPPNPP